jgi:hypothetical protein
MPFYELFTGPASHILDRWFESEILKTTLATDAVIGANISPRHNGRCCCPSVVVMCCVCTFSSLVLRWVFALAQLLLYSVASACFLLGIVLGLCSCCFLSFFSPTACLAARTCCCTT